MADPRTSAPDEGRVCLSWPAAARFAALVTAAGSAVTAVIAGVVFVMVGLPTPDVWYPVGCGALTALVATALHIPWLAMRPPQSRWGVLGRAVAVGYLSVAAAALVAGMVSVPQIAVQIAVVAVVVYSLTGAFLVPGAVAALLAPVLGPRWRRWRRPRAAVRP